MSVGPALVTDLYQLTMAQGYWKSGLADRETAFHLSFRQNPFGSGFSVAAGLETALELLDAFRYGPEELDYLSSLLGADGTPLFAPEFLRFLAGWRLSCDVDAVPEGTPVFASEPLVRVTGKLLDCQLLETPLLHVVNFQTLVATKAARICLAAAGAPVLEFGLRRAQGSDGGLAASRAAYVGGCDGTSNLFAGRRLGIPVSGTHAHSWVMSFGDERQAFEAYARAMPNNVTLLVDTYDTLDGVRNAIEVGKALRARGGKLLGIRLDSGDLAYLSIEARKLLDAAGLGDVKIAASNDLDEHLIASLVEQGARIDVYGVGTRLVTAWDQPALGGVYKMGAQKDAAGAWTPRVKVSEQAAKTSTPGILQVRRFFEAGEPRGDAVYDLLDGEPGRRETVIVDPLDPTRRKRFPADAESADLLVPVVRSGARVYDAPPLVDSRERARREVARLHPTIRRLVNPHVYPVGLERRLHERKTRLVMEARGDRPEPDGVRV